MKVYEAIGGYRDLYDGVWVYMRTMDVYEGISWYMNVNFSK